MYKRWIMSFVICAWLIGGPRLTAAAGPENRVLIRCDEFMTFNPNPFNDYKDPHPQQNLVPLDIILDYDQMTGEFPGRVISATQPGKLEVAAATYTISGKGKMAGELFEEWLVLDRIDGSLGYYYKHNPGPTWTLGEGGKCQRVEQRF